MELKSYANKRSGHDILIPMINVLVILSLLIIIIIISLLLIPHRYESLFKQISEQFGASWNKTFLFYIFYLLLLQQVIISITGLLMNSYRLKRKDDKYHYSLIVYPAISLIVIVIYLFFI